MVVSKFCLTRNIKMLVDMSIFGEILISRPAGREAIMGASAYIFNSVKSNEIILLDFKNIKVLTPGWADEFIIGLKTKLNNKINYINTENPSVKASLNTVFGLIDVSKYKIK